MFEINIATISEKNIVRLSQSDIEQLSLKTQNTIKELSNYRNKVGLFPWGYNKLINELRLRDK